VSFTRSWDAELGATWLDDPSLVSALDVWVRRRMLEHHRRAARPAQQDSLGPWTVDGLVSEIRRHAHSGHWSWATTAICFLQELLFCIDDGAVELSRHLATSFVDEVLTLRYLRNVIAHPARMPVVVGENAVDELCFRMDRDPEFAQFAAELIGNWSLFGDRRVTVFALRRLNTAGRGYIRQLGLLAQR